MSGTRPVRTLFRTVRMNLHPPSRGAKSMERLGIASRPEIFPTPSPHSSHRKGLHDDQ